MEYESPFHLMKDNILDHGFNVQSVGELQA